MRVLFYLPVVVPWWFEYKITPLIRAMAAVAEVHVLVPTFWNGIGIKPDHLKACVDLTHVHWHIYDGEQNATLGISAANSPELLEFVHGINADYTFLRTADAEAPLHFPGKVRYVMEGSKGSFPPFPSAPHWATLTPGLFDFGCLPELGASERERLVAATSPTWERLHEIFSSFAPSREAGLASFGLPTNKRIIVLPLPFAMQTDLFRVHIGFKSNSDIVLDVAARLGPDEFLAITDHPLNQLYVDPLEVRKTIASLGDRAKLMANIETKGTNTTYRLISFCDGLFIQNSKTFSVAGFFGTPMMRETTFRTGEWLRSFDDFDAFLASLRAGERRGADPYDARVWFGYHMANDLFDPNCVDAAEIIERIERPVDPNRWDFNIERYRKQARQWMPELFV